VKDDADPRRIPFRAMIPNAITAMALCMGLTGVRFAIGAEWDKAIAAIIIAGILDGMDGRIARLLRAQSKFGAELDSLSDNIAFGTAPALIIFLWSLKEAPRFGWIAALALAVCCALRLARFNARIQDFCNGGDTVCQGNGAKGTGSHLDYNKFATQAAAFAAAKV